MNEDQNETVVPEQPVVEIKAVRAAEPFLKPNTDIKLEGLRCSTCRDIKTDDELMKQPLDYKKNEDGSVTPTRYSVFCSKCQAFLCIYDPVAQQELKEMLETRNEIESRKSKPK